MKARSLLAALALATAAPAWADRPAPPQEKEVASASGRFQLSVRPVRHSFDATYVLSDAGGRQLFKIVLSSSRQVTVSDSGAVVLLAWPRDGADKNAVMLLSAKGLTLARLGYADLLTSEELEQLAFSSVSHLNANVQATFDEARGQLVLTFRARADPLLPGQAPPPTPAALTSAGSSPPSDPKPVAKDVVRRVDLKSGKLLACEQP
jgi:hypothetical protein